MNAYNPPLRAPQIDRWADVDALDDAADERAAEALERFQAQWPADRCQRLGRMMDGDYSQVWAEALAPKEADTPADAAVRGLIDDGELVKLSKAHRSFNRQSDASMKLAVGMIDQMKGERK